MNQCFAKQWRTRSLLGHSSLRLQETTTRVYWATPLRTIERFLASVLCSITYVGSTETFRSSDVPRQPRDPAGVTGWILLLRAALVLRRRVSTRPIATARFAKPRVSVALPRRLPSFLASPLWSRAPIRL